MSYSLNYSDIGKFRLRPFIEQKLEFVPHNDTK